MGLQVRLGAVPAAESTNFLTYLQNRVSQLHTQQAHLEAAASEVLPPRLGQIG
jgi:hypothetical protein